MYPLSQLVADFKLARARMEKLQNDTPRIIGNESVRIVKNNFRISGYDSGHGVTMWEKRKPATDAAYDRGKTTDKNGKQSKYRTGKNGTYKGSVYSSSKPLLMQTENLFNSLEYKAAKRRVTIGVNDNQVPYGKKMNEGGNGTPARKFMPKPSEPPNPKMTKSYLKKIKYERDKAMVKFKK